MSHLPSSCASCWYPARSPSSRAATRRPPSRACGALGLSASTSEVAAGVPAPVLLPVLLPVLFAGAAVVVVMLRAMRKLSWNSPISKPCRPGAWRPGCGQACSQSAAAAAATSHGGALTSKPPRASAIRRPRTRTHRVPPGVVKAQAVRRGLAAQQGAGERRALEVGGARVPAGAAEALRVPAWWGGRGRCWARPACCGASQPAAALAVAGATGQWAAAAAVGYQPVPTHRMSAPVVGSLAQPHVGLASNSPSLQEPH